MTLALRFAGLLCLALSACAPSPEPQKPLAASAEAAPAPAAPAPSGPVQNAAAVAGAWDVVSFEGHRPARLTGSGRAAYADFGPNGVGLRIECNQSGRAGTVGNGRFNSVRGDELQTVMSCGPERNARESRYFSFFEKSPTVEHLGADRLRLVAGGTELILERPAVRRLGNLPTPDELQGSWRMLDLTRFEPGVGTSGIGLSETPGRIVFEGDRLSYSRCPQYGVTFRWEEDGRLMKTSGALPAAPGDCRELAEPAINSRMPAAGDLLALLHANPQVERTSNGALLISTERLGLVITKAPCESLEQSPSHRVTRTVDCASMR
jgi:hypothetical protein